MRPPILIGVAEVGNNWELTGISPDDLASFDYDTIADHLAQYASPQVTVDIVVHNYEDRDYLAFLVHQFTETPVVCRRASPQNIPQDDRFFAGEIFIRPTSGRPRTTRPMDATQLHDLLDLATELRVRRSLEAARRMGLVLAETDAAQYDAELGHDTGTN